MKTHLTYARVSPDRTHFKPGGLFSLDRWIAFWKRAQAIGGMAVDAKQSCPHDILQMIEDHNAATREEVPCYVAIPRDIEYPDLEDRDQFIEDIGIIFDQMGSHGKNGLPTDPSDVHPNSSALAVLLLRQLKITVNDKEVHETVTGKRSKGMSLMESLAAKGLIETMKALALRKITEDQARADLEAA